MTRPIVVVENRSESLALNKLRAQNCSVAKGSGNTDGPKRKEKADPTAQTSCINWSVPGHCRCRSYNCNT